MKLTSVLLFSLMVSLALQAQSPSQPSAPTAASQGGTPGQTPAAPAQAPKPEGSAAPADSQSVDALPRKYIELWNTGNADLAKQLAPFLLISRGHRVAVDAGMLNRVINAWRTSLPDLTFKIDDTVIQGEKVVMRLTFTGTYTARLFPNTLDPALTTPKRKIRATEMLLFELKDGKIQQIWEQYDALAMQAQMGAQWRTNQEVDATAQPSKPEPTPAVPVKP